MATNDSTAHLQTIKKVQFGILGPDEIVSDLVDNATNRSLPISLLEIFFNFLSIVFFSLWRFVSHSAKCLSPLVASGILRQWSEGDPSSAA